MRVAVTGASGFIGGAVCRAAVNAGWQVHAFGRRATAIPGAVYHRWDIDTGPLAHPPEIDVVVHAAAAVRDWGPTAPIWRTNLEGTRHLLATFPDARLVHVSSASVYDPYVPTVCAREDAAPVDRYRTAYAASKAAAERLIAARPATVVLRPHAVYGPGDRTLLPRVLRAVRGNTLWIVGDGRTQQSLTSVANLVAATLLACDPAAPSGTYNIADARSVAVGDALREFLAARGVRVRVRTIPQRPAWVLASIAEATARLARRPYPPRLTRYAVAHLAVERTLDLTRARRTLGLRPTLTSFEGADTW
jgi:2-alkyl-3-oxoalkanoate reductase